MAQERAYRDPQRLTQAELEVLHEIARGAPDKEIARVLGITEKTVRVHGMHIFSKLGVRNRTEATLVAIRRGVVPPPLPIAADIEAFYRATALLDARIAALDQQVEFAEVRRVINETLATLDARVRTTEGGDEL
jgi:DNA-binding CsgD family transcriptional regulator